MAAAPAFRLPPPTSGKPPPTTPRTIRRALYVLGRLHPHALALIAQLAIDHLDAAENTDCDADEFEDAPALLHSESGPGDADDGEFDNEAGCEVDDFPAYAAGPGDPDDAEEDDDHGRDDPDEPEFPSRAFGRPPAVITRADRPVSLRSLGARR